MKHQKQAHFANLEDNLQKEDVLYEMQSVRPDLQDHNKTVIPLMYPKVTVVLLAISKLMIYIVSKIRFC
jgi:hypothetical protein